MDFISKLLEEMHNENNTYDNNIFINKELPNLDHYMTYISNNCRGGWPSDKIFYLDNKGELKISIYLIKQYFGSNFRIELYEEAYEEYNEDEETGLTYTMPYFSIVGPSDKFNEIYKNSKKNIMIKKKTL